MPQSPRFTPVLGGMIGWKSDGVCENCSHRQSQKDGDTNEAVGCMLIGRDPKLQNTRYCCQLPRRGMQRLEVMKGQQATPSPLGWLTEGRRRRSSSKPPPLLATVISVVVVLLPLLALSKTRMVQLVYGGWGGGDSVLCFNAKLINPSCLSPYHRAVTGWVCFNKAPGELPHSPIPPPFVRGNNCNLILGMGGRREVISL